MLDVQNLSIRADSFQLNSISFQIKSGECTTLMGASGSGKTTIMEAICGLRDIHSGRIVLAENDITHLRPGERHIALVPQDNVLFPHLSVREHLSFGPAIQKWPKPEIHQRSDELARDLKITHLLERKPLNLSGGEAKRVALGRALATRPSLLCLDEAFTALDDETHASTLQLLRETIEKEKMTTLHITHSLSDAKELSKTLIHMSELTTSDH